MVEPESPLLSQLKRVGVVAVIRAASAEAAVEAARALLKGGLVGIEITFSTPQAEKAIVTLREAHHDALVGAGTVLDASMLEAACSAGAQFLVSPHFDASLMSLARQRGVPLLPGAFTPTEIHTAFRAGAPAIKLFPAAALGPSYLKAIRGPLPHIPLMPTGGITADNLHEWLDAGALAVGAGGSLLRGSYEDMTSAARGFAEALSRYRAR